MIRYTGLLALTILLTHKFRTRYERHALGIGTSTFLETTPWLKRPQEAPVTQNSTRVKMPGFGEGLAFSVCIYFPTTLDLLPSFGSQIGLISVGCRNVDVAFVAVLIPSGAIITNGVIPGNSSGVRHLFISTSAARSARSTDISIWKRETSRSASSPARSPDKMRRRNRVGNNAQDHPQPKVAGCILKLDISSKAALLTEHRCSAPRRLSIPLHASREPAS